MMANRCRLKSTVNSLDREKDSLQSAVDDKTEFLALVEEKLQNKVRLPNSKNLFDDSSLFGDAHCRCQFIVGARFGKLQRPDDGAGRNAAVSFDTCHFMDMVFSFGG